MLMITLVSGCAPGFLSTSGTNFPKELIGVAYSRMKSNRITGARNVLKRSIEQSQKHDDAYALAVSYNMMGFTYVAKEQDSGKALNYYNKALVLIENNNFECELIHYYIGVSLVNNLLEIPENACSYRDKALKALTIVKNNFRRKNIKYEGGWQAISIAEERIEKLDSEIDCKY